MKTKSIILSLFVCIAITGCKNSSSEGAATNAASIPNSIIVDLNKYGYPLAVEIPDSNSGTAEIIAQSWGAVEIKVGEVFHVSIRVGDGELVDMTFQKSMIEGNELPKFKKYLVDEPSTILYEAEITGPEWHFYSIQNRENTDYVVEDIKGMPFSQKQMETMLQYAKTLKAIPKTNS